MKLKKVLASILCIAMVLSTMSFAVFAEATVYEVKDDAELADALSKAVDYDIIKLAPGEYTGGISVGKNITLEGSVDAGGNPITVFSGENDASNSYYYYSIYMNKGTIKNIKIVDAWKGIMTEGVGSLTIDNVTMEKIAYGIHIAEAKNADDIVTIENCHLDITWANSFCGGAYKIIMQNNVFTAEEPYYGKGSGANAVNTFNPNTIVKENIFEEDAKILIREEAKDGVEIGANYYEEGFENALSSSCAEGVVIETYYPSREMTEVKTTPKGTLNSCRVNDADATRTFITTELNTVYAEKSIKLEILDADGNVIATTVSTDKVFEDITFPTGAFSIFTGINSTDDYWTTTWASQKLRGDIEPNKAILYVDDIKTSEIDFAMKGAISDKDIVWSEVSGVFNPHINGVYLGGSYDNAYLCVEVYDFYLGETFEVKYFSNGEHIATASLKEGMLPSGARDSIGCCLGFNGDFDEYWKAEWFVPANAEQIPNKVEVYVDGVKIAEKEGSFGNYIKGWDPESNGNWLYELINEDWIKINGVYTEAKIGNTGYSSFDAAISAAVDGDTIDLMGNVVELAGTQQMTVKNKDIIIINGTIDITGIDISANAIWLLDNSVLTFDDVNLIGDGYDSAFGVIYLVTTEAGVKFINSTVDLDADGKSGGFVKGEGYMGTVLIDNSDITLVATNRGFISTEVTIQNDSHVSISGDKSLANYGIENAFNICGITLKDTSTIDIKDCYEYGIKIGDAAINIEDTAKVTATGNGIADIAHRAATNTGVLTIGENAVVEAENIVLNNEVAGEGEIISKADMIYVQYKKVDVDADGNDTVEGSDEYEIVLVGADEEKINELASADLTFNFNGTPVNDGDMSYTVAPADGVTLTQLGDRFMFNYDGITKYEESGVAIVIGTITIDGYGSYTLATADSDKNAVYATEIRDNIVDGFEDAATLIINTDLAADDGMVGEITDGEITVPTRTLTIDITFPNAVENNVADYQNMTVTIVGGTVNETIALGTDGEDYNFTRELPYNTAYTVTVSGAGYRTARYTVNLNDDKQLNFWNNVMDEAQVVEIGKDSSIAKVTFLAGDIVKDNNINIYDLSAVVSYFGEELDTAAYNEYAKYDLNRDGVIDSKDVAYVLVSWNN